MNKKMPKYIPNEKPIDTGRPPKAKEIHPDASEKIIPYGTRLYVLVDDVAEKTYGNIILPEVHGELTRIATVIKVGDKVTYFKPGDRVLLMFFTGIDINLFIPGEGMLSDLHRIITEQNVLAKIKED